jgi:hypothetical protein
LGKYEENPNDPIGLALMARCVSVFTYSEPRIMTALDVEEKRRSPRHRLGRLATTKLGVGIAPRYCLVTNISEEGVRLQLNGIEVLEDFVLLFPGEKPGRDGTYRAVWRNGNDVGAKFISDITQNA